MVVNLPSIIAASTGGLVGYCYHTLTARHFQYGAHKALKIFEQSAGSGKAQKIAVVRRFAFTMLLRFGLLLAILVGAALCCKELFGAFGISFALAFLARTVFYARESV